MTHETKKWFAVCDFWAADPLLWRKDLWETAESGSKPDTWEDILRVGRKLKAKGNPIGIGMSAELDSNCALRGLLYSYGAFIQDEKGNVVINSPQTIEALKISSAIFKEAMSPEVIAWSASSNNAYILSGTGSLVVNAISGLGAIEKKKVDLAKNVLLAPKPAGPVCRLGPANVLGAYVIWRFSEVANLAKKFLIDLIGGYGDAFSRSEFYNLPSFPGTIPNLSVSLAKDAAASPEDKNAMLSTSEEWSTNLGYPGSSNAAEMEVVDTFIIPEVDRLIQRWESHAQDVQDVVKNAETAVIIQSLSVSLGQRATAMSTLMKSMEGKVESEAEKSDQAVKKQVMEMSDLSVTMAFRSLGVAAGSGEVSSMIDNIISVSEENNAAVEEVSAATEQMSAQVSEVSSSAQVLEEMATNLQATVSRFQV